MDDGKALVDYEKAVAVAAKDASAAYLRRKGTRSR
jgi:hypothetical protein